MSNTIYSPLVIRNRCQEYANRPYPTEVSRGKVGAIISKMEKALTVGNEVDPTAISHKRRWVLGFLFLSEESKLRQMSSKELTPQMFNALFKWIYGENVSGDWIARPAFISEIRWVYNKAKFALSIQDNVPQFTMSDIKLIAEEDYSYDVEKGGLAEAAVALGGLPKEIGLEFTVKEENKVEQLQFVVESNKAKVSKKEDDNFIDWA